MASASGISANRGHIVSLDNDTVRLWETENENVLIAEFTVHDNEVLASAGFDGSILLWDLNRYLNEKT